VAVARGVIVQLSGDSATLSTDKWLPPAFARHLRLDAGADWTMSLNRQPDGREGTPSQPSWRLDRDEVASVSVRLRRNLMGASTSRLNPRLLYTYITPWSRLSGRVTCSERIKGTVWKMGDQKKGTW
jgi:hypothetical protein